MAENLIVHLDTYPYIISGQWWCLELEAFITISIYRDFVSLGSESIQLL